MGASLELVLRTAAALQLVMLAALMLRVRRDDHTRIVGALACLGVAAFVVTSVRGATGFLGPAVYPLTALCVTKAALFWLFAKGLFSEDFRVRPEHVGICVATCAFGLWQQLVLSGHPRSSFETVASFGFEAVVLAFVILALREAYRGLAADLVERRRRVRILFVCIAGAYLAAAVIVQSYNLLLGTRTPALLTVANLALIWAMGLAATWTLIQLRPGSWIEPPPRAIATQLLSALEQRVLAALKMTLENDRVYREENLSIGKLAQRLGTREHVLRRVINQGLGFRNFNEFLHEHRIKEACQRLHEPDEARLPVLSIALDVGYGSIGPFNRAFKARTGMTPTEFRGVSPSP